MSFSLTRWRSSGVFIVYRNANFQYAFRIMESRLIVSERYFYLEN